MIFFLLSFSSSNLGPENAIDRSRDFSVRLVIPVPTPDEVAANAVKDLIDAICNPVVYTNECKDAIDDARDAYDALTAAQKALVDNYSTFYDGTRRFTLPAGVEAFVAKLVGTDLHLTSIATEGQVIPKATGLILRADEGAFVLTPSLNDGATFDPSDNCLLGTDVTMDAPANCYVISGHSADNSVVGVGFYQFSGTLKAHKAYTIYSNGGAAPKRMRFVFNQEQVATDVESNQQSAVSIQKVIENGQLYILRGDRKYIGSPVGPTNGSNQLNFGIDTDDQW